jgi:hypothetical protein
LKYYTIIGLLTAMALVTASVLAGNIQTEVFAKVKVAPNDSGCDNGLKEEDAPDKCDGFIIQGQDDLPEEPDVD